MMETVMTHMRREFSEATKRQALERAGWRCQDPLCGISKEWKGLWQELRDALLLPFPGSWGAVGAQQEDLIWLRDLILSSRFRFPKALKPIIKKFKLDGGALLEVDHATECADGGDNSLGNAVVRCVFCHFFKTQERARVRPKVGSKLRKKQAPEQLNVITHATVRGLQGTIDAVKERKTLSPLMSNLMDYMGIPPKSELEPEPTPPRKSLPRERRHTSERQFVEAVQRREQAIEDNWFGV